MNDLEPLPVDSDPDPLLRSFGRRVAMAIAESGLSIEEVAASLGIPPIKLTSMQCGAVDPTLTEIVGLAAVIGCRPGPLIPDRVGAAEPKTLAHRVQALRVGLNWSQMQLAEEANVAPMTVVRVETGQQCRTGTVEKLAAALGVSAGELLSGVAAAG